MSEERRSVPVIHGADGVDYCLLKDAATFLGASVGEIKRTLPIHEARGVLVQPPKRGRPVEAVVALADVEERRRAKLQQLGVVDGSDAVSAQHINRLKLRVKELEAEVDSLKSELNETFCDYQLAIDDAERNARELGLQRRRVLENRRERVEGR